MPLRRVESIRPYLPAIGLFAVAFIIRFSYLYGFKDALFLDCLSVDLKYYHDWAERIVSGEIMGSEVFEMTPLYAYSLALFYKIFTTDLFILRLVQISIGSVGVLLVASITAKLLGSRRMGLIAGLAAALYGPFIMYDAMIMKTFLAVFFALVMVFFLVRLEERSLVNPFIAGLALALAALVRENIILLIPIVPLWIVFSVGMERKASKVALFLVGVFILIAPVTLRNYHLSGQFVLITSGGGEVFYTGNNPDADGTYKPPAFVRPTPEYEHEDFRQKAMEITGRELTRKESSDFWFDQGLEFISGEPAAFAKLLVRKFFLFWNFYEHPDNHNYYFHRTHSGVLGAPLLHYGVIAPIGLMGFLLALGRFRRFGLLQILLLTYMASVMLVFNFARFRLPAAPLLIIFSAYYLQWAAISIKERRTGRLLITCAPLVLFFVVSNYKMLPEDPYASEFDTAYTSRGICLGEAGRTEEALVSFNKALEFNPNYSGALLGAGTALLRLGDTDAALKSFVRAVASDGSSTYAHFGLAEALSEKGNYRAAAAEYARALRYEPDHPVFLARYASALVKARDYGEAALVYESFLDSYPGSNEAFYGLSLAYEGMGDDALAIENLETFLGSCGEDPRRGEAAERLKRLKRR